MTTAVNNTSSNAYAALGLNGSSSSSSSTGSAALGQQDFLTLMTQQLQDQDPLHPVSNAEFFSQIAQFSTVSGISQLNSSFTSLASQLTSNQSLQAAGLIGHGVLVQGNKVEMSGSGLAGAVEVPASGDVTVSIKDSSGATVGTLDLGVQSAGTVPFSWDGKDGDGNTLPSGTYTISAQVGSGSNAQAATTDVAALVNSVSMSSSGTLTLNLQGLGAVPFSNVRQIIS